MYIACFLAKAVLLKSAYYHGIVDGLGDREAFFMCVQVLKEFLHPSCCLPILYSESDRKDLVE